MNEDTSDDLDFIKNPNECIKVMKFISSIEIDYKPCFNSFTVINKNSWFTTLKRRWNGEKGEEGILYVNKILCSCDKLYRMCLIERDVLLGLYEDSVVGLDNLIITYSDQESVCDGYRKIKETVVDSIKDLTYQDNTDQDNTDQDNNNISDNKHDDKHDDKHQMEEYQNQKKVITKYTLVPLKNISKPSSSFFNNKNIVYLKYQED